MKLCDDYSIATRRAELKLEWILRNNLISLWNKPPWEVPQRPEYTDWRGSFQSCCFFQWTENGLILTEHETIWKLWQLSFPLHTCTWSILYYCALQFLIHFKLFYLHINNEKYLCTAELTGPVLLVNGWLMEIIFHYWAVARLCPM